MVIFTIPNIFVKNVGKLLGCMNKKYNVGDSLYLKNYKELFRLIAYDTHNSYYFFSKCGKLNYRDIDHDRNVKLIRNAKLKNLLKK